MQAPFAVVKSIMLLLSGYKKLFRTLPPLDFLRQVQRTEVKLRALL